MEQKRIPCAGVFSGGGVRGIGHVGAARVFEQRGYCFAETAGTSAGAIVASLLAVGYTAEEIRQEMQSLDYGKFKERDWPDYLGTPGKLVSLAAKFGIYGTDYFRGWLSGLLRKKGKLVFGDLGVCGAKGQRCPLQVTATDLSDRRLLRLPADLAEFGLDPWSYPIADGVCMSMSMPIFYEPFRLTDNRGKVHFIVDGGLLSNTPTWMLDDGESAPRHPIFSFQFQSGQPRSAARPKGKLSVIDYSKLLVAAALDGCDGQYGKIAKGDKERTVLISTTLQSEAGPQTIAATDFDLTPQEGRMLFQNGMYAAERFLGSWNFEHWIKTYRQD